MALEIKEITDKRDLKKFIKFPFKLYKNCKYWVPPLIIDELKVLSSKKNPAFDFCDVKLFLAYDNNNIVGRIAGIINHRFIEKWKKKVIRFGWIDFIEDRKVAKLLLDTVAQWGKNAGMEYMEGPLGFTDFDPEGMLVEGYNEMNTFTTIYNYKYYPEYLTEYGFKKEVDWLEFEIKTPEKIPEKAERISEIAKQRNNVRILDIKTKKDLMPYKRQFFDIINSTYSNLHGFVELTEKQIQTYIKQYFGFIVLDYFIIIIDGENKMAGFVIGLPSLSSALRKSKGKLLPFGFIHILRALRKKNKYVDLYLGAVRPDLQGKGTDALLITEFTRSCIANGVICTESNIELESNTLVQAHWKHFESRQHKRRRCFSKKII